MDKCTDNLPCLNEDIEIIGCNAYNHDCEQCAANNKIIQALTLRAEQAEATSKELVKTLANIASTLGHGGLVGSDIYNARKEFAIYASKSLRKLGYEYYENCGADGHIDGWFTESELKASPYIEPKGEK